MQFGQRLTIAFAVFALYGADDPAKDDLKLQQGEWKAVSSRRGGEDAPDDIVSTIRRKVVDDQVTWSRSGKRFAGTTIVLDPKSDPKAIDVIPDGGASRGKRVLGIYRLKDDRLTICMADADKERPKEFEAEAGQMQTLMVFERVKTDESKNDE